MMRAATATAMRAHGWIAAGFIGAALVLGGGGSPAPHSELLLQLVACLALLAWLWLPAGPVGAPRPMEPLIWWLGALVLTLPLLQLIPLPSALWQALPGQEGRLAALQLVGAADSWQPWTQSPPRTLAALLSLLPPLFAGFATAALDHAGRQRVLLAAAVAIGASALLGVAQVSLGSDALRPYAETHRDFLVGFQANRNAQADVLLIGVIIVAALGAPLIAGAIRRPSRHGASGVTPRVWWLLGGGLVAALLLATVMTGSRMGIALAAVAGLFMLLIVRPLLPAGTARLAGWLTGGLAVLAIGGYLLLQGNSMVQRTAERFEVTGDARTELWQDTLFAVRESWPAGVGLGGYQPAMLAAERLEVLDGSRPNRAHNDYLEFVLEGGLPAVLIGLAALGVLAALAWRALRLSGDGRAQVLCGCGILLIVALHSFVDYPLRSMALACMFGVGAGLLARPAGSVNAPVPGATVTARAGAKLAA
ncbi:O-antigen ligase family protein [Croceibacterium sp. TMG7-5b_MA50]|uniref:O-antigen ligase family protein n=1 Tax=Croceibacterium sp. TMG7-5b_MA50 TaxID=3121290 RepID=UPI0032216E9B